MNMLNRCYQTNLSGFQKQYSLLDRRDHINVRARFNKNYVVVISHTCMPKMEQHIDPARKNRIDIACPKQGLPEIITRAPVFSSMSLQYPALAFSVLQGTGDQQSCISCPLWYGSCVPGQDRMSPLQFPRYDIRLFFLRLKHINDRKTKDESIFMKGSMSFFLGSFSTCMSMPPIFNAGSAFSSAFIDERGRQ